MERESKARMTKKQKTKEIVDRLESFFGIPEKNTPMDPLDSLILTVLSQSTNDKNRDQAFQGLKRRFPRWQDVLDADVSELEEAIRPGGLYRQKSARIRDILLWVKEEFGALDLNPICSEPSEKVMERFTKIKGIGIKTISVVLLFSCGRDVFPVDTHVHRICRRLGLVPDKATAEKTHHLMAPLVPEGKAHSLHLNLLNLGRRVCLSRNPRCAGCPLKDLCKYGRRKK